MRASILIILSVLSAFSFSCESSVSPGLDPILFYTSKYSFKLDRGDGRSETISATIKKVQSDSIQLFLTCWPWDNLQVLQAGKWQHFQSVSDPIPNPCEEWAEPVYLSDSINLSLQFQTSDSVSPGIYRLGLLYKGRSMSSQGMTYSNGFILVE
jgi:hypothetical protein